MAILMRHKSSIFGLETDLLNLSTSISNEASARQAADGDLALLSTTAKSDLVSAVNELFTTAGEVSNASLQISQNLADLADAAAARTNLGVYSTGEVDTAISQAQLAMGTNFNAPDIASRDAMTGLDVADRVFVADDGDTKWALYKVGTVDASGAGTSWLKVMDQDALENSISKEAIKTQYEMNPDTNAFTDAEQTKVGFVSVTQAIDLDDAVLKAELVQDLATSSPVDQAVSAAQVKAYAEEAARLGGSSTAKEELVVTSGAITLTNAPKDGVASVMNFGTVRYTDANGVSYDAPVVGTADPLVYTVSTDTAGQWDGFTVQVQYSYTAA